jgi:hypothetical protein
MENVYFNDKKYLYLILILISNFKIYFNNFNISKLRH